VIYLLTAIGLPLGGSSKVHIYTQTILRTTQNKQYIEQHNNLGKCGSCPVLARFTLAFALQLRKKQGKTSVRVAETSDTKNYMIRFLNILKVNQSIKIYILKICSHPFEKKHI